MKQICFQNEKPQTPRQALQLALDDWHRSQVLPFPRRSLDLACGSGEATVALEAWLHKFSKDVVVEAADPYTFEVGSLGKFCSCALTFGKCLEVLPVFQIFHVFDVFPNGTVMCCYMHLFSRWPLGL